MNKQQERTDMTKATKKKKATSVCIQGTIEKKVLVRFYRTSTDVLTVENRRRHDIHAHQRKNGSFVEVVKDKMRNNNKRRTRTRSSYLGPLILKAHAVAKKAANAVAFASFIFLAGVGRGLFEIRVQIVCCGSERCS